MGNLMYIATSSSADDILEKFQISGGIPKEALSTLTTQGMIFGVLMAVFCIFAAFAAKQGRVLCFFAAVANLASSLLVPKTIADFHNLEMIKYFYGTSQDDVNNQITQYYKDSLPDLIVSLLASLVTLLAFILTLILICKLLKVKPKFFSVTALILHIVRYIAVSPICLITPLLGKQVTLQAQLDQAVVYYIVTLLPVVLIAIGSIFELVRRNKSKEAVLPTE